MGDCSTQADEPIDGYAAMRLYSEQLKEWPLLAANTDALHRGVMQRGVSCGNVQHNPARAVSSGAKVDAASIASRPCFLCECNRPAEQRSLPLGRYEVLCNPFPIFPGHFTIASVRHEPQRIMDRVDDFLEVARAMSPLALFYNGPECGASAPDHAHFQAVESAFLPITSIPNRIGAPYASNGCVSLYDSLPPFFHIVGSRDDVADALRRLLDALPRHDASPEPRVNLIALAGVSGEYQIFLIPRSKHRPDIYGTAPGQMLVSPGTIDMAGVMVLPRRADYDSMTSEQYEVIIKEVSLPVDDLKKILHSL